MDTLITEIKSWQGSDLLLQLAQFLVWTFLILFLTWLIRNGFSKTIGDNALRYRARKVTRFVSYVLIALLAIITFAGKMQYFTITIGLLSAGLAFALQEVILSFAGWIAIFSAHLYKPGDRIEINNVKGDVIDIGITKTTMMEIGEWVGSDNYSGRIVQMSNSFVFKGPIRNYTTDFPFVWDEIKLPIRYGSDITIARQLIQDAAHRLLQEYANFAKEHWKRMVTKYLIENANVEPTLAMKLTDNWVEFTLRYVVDYKKRRSTKDMLFTDILKSIERTEGKVSLASATVEIVSTPEFLRDKT